MSDTITTKVDVNTAFKAASKPPVVQAVTIKPEVIPDIVANLGKLQKRMDEGEVKKSGDTYALMDKRTNLPLAELNEKSGLMTMYQSPKDLAKRIDSAFISERTISNFINESRVPSAPENTVAPPAQLAMAAAR